MITNIHDTPFDEAQANHMAQILSRETGRRYRPIPFMEGYGIVHSDTEKVVVYASNNAPFIYLRPAIQSQLIAILAIAILASLYNSMESTLLWLRLDNFRTSLFDMTGRTFPWQTTVSLLEKIALLAALLTGWNIFYNLASRAYMIGPKGVETSVGMFNKDEMRVEYKHVRGMRVRRSFIQRLLFYGTIEIATSGTDESEIKFRNISNPKKYMAILKERTKLEL